MTRVIGSTDVYSRKHLDRQLDRLDRLHAANKQKIADLKQQLASLSLHFRVFEEEKAD